MKLIDILVEELPKRGGWPEGSTRCMQTDGLYVTFPDIGDHCDFVAKCMAEGVRIATREQYEIALADSKPKWDGVGLPPVGSNVEARFEGGWVEVTVAYNDCPESQSDESVWNEALVFNRITTRPFWADEFRPIRSKADKKRDEIILQMSHSLRANGAVTEEQLCRLYSDIASGYIPHIHID
ncbi:TPA: hypothetical protein ACXHW4_001632 [Enterobacter hormaechei]